LAIDRAQASIDDILRTFHAMLPLSRSARTLVCDAYRPGIEASDRSLRFAADDHAVISGDRR
jgi:hypothetical protein